MASNRVSGISIPTGTSATIFYLLEPTALGTPVLTAFAATTSIMGPIASASLNITIKTATAILAGYHHACAIIWDEVQCWGSNSFGQLGNRAVSVGPSITSMLPVPVNNLASGIFSISTSGGVNGSGGATACALIGGGTAMCWGLKSKGQVGDSTTTYRSTPVAVVSTLLGTAVTSISVGALTSCGLGSGNTLFCWGGNSNGELGATSPLFNCTLTLLTELKRYCGSSHKSKDDQLSLVSF